MKEEGVSLRTIAKATGVSRAVVSAVINKKENQRIFVSQKKREEILKLVEEYGYVPKKSARDLGSQRTNTIALLFHWLTPYFSSLLEEIHRQAFKKGLEVIPYITEGYPDKEEEYLNLMRDGRVDVILAAAFTEGSPDRYMKFSSPPYNLKIVTINPPVGNIPSVHFDEEDAGRLAAQHLIEIGCKNLCFIDGGGIVEKRMEGFAHYIRERKLPVASVIQPMGLFPDGVALAKKVFNLEKLPDGIFAYNDPLAIAVLTEVLRRGLKVPDDIAIVGCDNTEVCLYCYPALTSIDTNVSQVVKIALQKVVDLTNGMEAEPRHTKVPVKLVIRESTNRV